MTGRLKQLDDGRFCVEYSDRGVYVAWRPGESANAAKPMAWIAGDHPRQPQVPVNKLRDVIGSKARFFDRARIAKNKVEIPGHLDDGGSITIVYAIGRPPRDLTETERDEGANILKEWTHSYLRNDV